MASLVMQQGKVNACFVGCDRIARNGDTANKIGTSGLAILANYYSIPFYVLGPSSTIDFACPTGKQIPIELRSESEIKEAFFAKPSALSSVHCFNPAFDVTAHTLISGIVTERGICYPPFDETISHLFPKEYKENTL
jgi:methylthioribose-1-phosphate isomerase